ncbi:MAG TPA: PqqD family protein [Gemmatimonadales bacterium]|jgi:hypothetical protein|nr:PqqD family protein [Gemmatimonadales bacterium]
MRTLKPNLSAVAAKVIDGEAIIMNLTNGAYYSMAGVGGFIWDAIEREQSDAAILEGIMARYDVAAPQARADLDGLIAALLADELIVMEGNGAATEGTPPATGTESYEAPELHKHTEMADLLALDPPMPALTDVPASN